MADLITRLKVDSTEYDAKIKRAAQGLQHYVKSAHDSGDVIGRLLGDTKKYVESLGNMATVSTTARGRLNELTAAFTDLRSVYNQLSDEEKNAKGGFGQELNKQLEILKGRINDTKAELKDIDAELGNTKQAEDNTKSGLEGLTSALGINVKSLASWGAALSAGKVALDVAKDAFFASEATVDEWGRTMQSVQSLYEGFLISINNGDISGFLSRMDDIVKAARAAYNELDTLGTMKTIQAPKISAQQTENERIRNMIQTGRYIAPIDGRKNAVFNGREMQNGDKLTAGQIRALEKQLQGGMQNVVKLVGNEVKQTGKAINAYYDSIAKQNGMSLQEFKKGTSTWEEFDKKIKGYEEYKKWDAQARTEFAKQGGRGNVNFDKNNPFAEFKKWGTFRVDKMGENSYNDLVRLIQQRDQQAGQAYGMQSQAYRTMNRAEGVTVSKIMGRGGSGKGGKQDLDAEQQVQAQINALLKEALTADTQRQSEIRKQVAELQQQQQKYKEIKDVAQGILPKDKQAVFTIDGQLTEKTKNALSTIKGVTMENTEVGITITANTGEALKQVQSLVGDVSQISLEPRVEIPGTLADYQKQLKDTAENIQNMREELLRMKEAGADPMKIGVKEESLKDAIGKLNDIQNKIDYLNGKEVNIDVNLTAQGDTDMGEAMINDLETSLINAADHKDLTTFSKKWIESLSEGAEDADFTEYLDYMKESLGEAVDEQDWPKIKLAVETGDIKTIEAYQKKVQDSSKKTEEGWKEATGAIGQLGNALNSIEDPTAKVFGTVLQGIAGVAAGFGNAAKGPFTSPWEYIAFAASGIAAMISAITAIHSATGFANGGIVKAANGTFVPGNNMSGDMVPALLNSGELVLNKAQQGNLASQLEGGGMQNLQLDTVISGEEIRLVLNNNGRRTGRGEYVQTNRR